jgi:hypothetical protein
MRVSNGGVQAIVVVGGWLAAACGSPGELQSPGGRTPGAGEAGGGPVGAVAAAAPTMSPAPGVYSLCHPWFVESLTVPVTLSNAMAGAIIHYTTDDTTPTAASPRYTAPIALTATATIKAVAIADGVSSAVASGTYTIAPANDYGMVADPIIEPGNGIGAYASAQTVTLADPTPGAVLYYAVVDLTASGSEGPESAPFTVYTGPFTVDRTSVVEAYASLAGQWCSPAFEGDWLTISKVAPPEMAPSGAFGTCDGTRQVFVGEMTPGATVHFTTDGSIPTAASPSFPSSGITVPEGAQLDLRALATAPGLDDSVVVEGSYSAYQDWNACWANAF